MADVNVRDEAAVARAKTFRDIAVEASLLRDKAEHDPSYTEDECRVVVVVWEVFEAMLLARANEIEARPAPRGMGHLVQRFGCSGMGNTRLWPSRSWCFVNGYRRRQGRWVQREDSGPVGTPVSGPTLADECTADEVADG